MQREYSMLEPLTQRQHDVVRCLVIGLSYKELAAELGLTYDAARGYVRDLCAKYAVSGRTELLALLCDITIRAEYLPAPRRRSR